MNGAFGQVDNLCLAEFAAYYYKHYKPIEDRQNDNQPVILTDQILENQHSSSQIIPTKISLMTKEETMKCQKVKAVIRFHKPAKQQILKSTFIMCSCYILHGEKNLI